MVGHRLIAQPAVPDDVRQEYHDRVIAAWQTMSTKDLLGRPVSNVLRFSPQAEEAMGAFETDLEPKLAPEGELTRLCCWPQKLAARWLASRP
jgi:hypothetical protein